MQEGLFQEARFASGIAVSEAYNPEIESTVQFKKDTRNMIFILRQRTMKDF